MSDFLGMKKTFSNKKIVILGADGFLGSCLFERLAKLGADVWGTSRKSKGQKIFYLDVLKKESIENFPWSKFDIIFDCIGNIDYKNSIESAEHNFQTNFIGPVHILKKLSDSHKYFYCSTHAVLSALEKQNSYSLSKLSFELCVKNAKDICADVRILRIPAIFSEKRQSGLLYTIKKSFEEKKSFDLDFYVSKWHTMYLPRLIDILVLEIQSEHKEVLKNIGYSTETNIKTIIGVAKEILGLAPVRVISAHSDRYIPKVKAGAPNKKDFEKDLIKFFQK